MLQLTEHDHSQTNRLIEANMISNRPSLPFILLTTVLLLFANNKSQAQINTTFMGIGAQHTLFNYKSGTGLVAYLDVPVSKNWSLHYSAGIGKADQTGLYTHIPLPAAAAFVASIIHGEFGWLGVVVCMIPEGISYTVRKTQRVDLRLTATPLSLYFWKSEIEWKDPMIPQIGTMFLIKQKSGMPILKLHASLLNQVSTQSTGVQIGGMAIIPLK